jgi:hypothetical protein
MILMARVSSADVAGATLRDPVELKVGEDDQTRLLDPEDRVQVLMASQ